MLYIYIPFEEYIEEHVDELASAYCVIIFLEKSLEFIGVPSLYDLRTHAVQCLNGLVDGVVLLFIMCVDGGVLLVIMCVVEPDAK